MGVLEELLYRQIARLPPIGSPWIAEADEARERGAADPFPLGKCSKRDAFAWASVAFKRRALSSSVINPGSGFAANGSVPSIPF